MRSGEFGSETGAVHTAEPAAAQFNPLFTAAK